MRSRHDRHPPANRLHRGGEDSLTILAFHRGEFARTAERRNRVDPLANEPVDVRLQPLEPQRAVFVKRRDGRSADASKHRLGHDEISGFELKRLRFDAVDDVRQWFAADAPWRRSGRRFPAACGTAFTLAEAMCDAAITFGKVRSGLFALRHRQAERTPENPAAQPRPPVAVPIKDV